MSITITGRDIQPQLISPAIHQDTTNEYFCSINSDREYVVPAVTDIADDATIPEIPLHVVTHFLSKLKRTACGPTGFLEILPMILLLLLPMCLTASCYNIKFHLL